LLSLKGLSYNGYPTSAAAAIRPLNAAVNHKSNKMLHLLGGAC